MTEQLKTLTRENSRAAAEGGEEQWDERVQSEEEYFGEVNSNVSLIHCIKCKY